MTRAEIVEQVNGVLLSGFEIDAAKLTPEAHLYYDLGIDSLDAIDMLVYIEEKIGRSVDATLFKDVRKVSEIYDVLESIQTADANGGAVAHAVGSASDESAASS